MDYLNNSGPATSYAWTVGHQPVRGSAAPLSLPTRRYPFLFSNPLQRAAIPLPTRLPATHCNAAARFLFHGRPATPRRAIRLRLPHCAKSRTVSHPVQSNPLPFLFPFLFPSSSPSSSTRLSSSQRDTTSGGRAAHHPSASHSQRGGRTMAAWRPDDGSAAARRGDGNGVRERE